MSDLFDEYKYDWLKKHPNSVPTEEMEDSPYPGWVKILVLVGFVLAALLSGVHTMMVVYDGIKVSALVDETMRQWVSRGSFVVYEICMFAAAYLMAVVSTKLLARVAAAIIFTTLIATNLYSVNQIYGFDFQNNAFGSFVTALFSLVPILAYSLSKLYINIGSAERLLKRKAKDAYKEAMQKMDATILKDFKKDSKASNPPSKDRLLDDQPEPPKSVKLPDASQRVIDYLRDNPADIDGLSSARLASKLGVSKATANNAQRRLKGGYLNGHDSSGEMLQ